MVALGDGPKQMPIDPKVVQKVILSLLPKQKFDLILPHSPFGEYTRHLRHEEIGKAVIELWKKRKFNHKPHKFSSMKVLVLYDYPLSPGGLATQGDLLLKGLLECGVDAHAAHFESAQEKEWYYRWFEPDVVMGVGYWGHTTTCPPSATLRRNACSLASGGRLYCQLSRNCKRIAPYFSNV